MVTEGQQEHDEYKTTLDAETLQTARLELREDDSTREQALKQFRHWIEKHPAIKKCRTDSLFLLRFLRTKKFSLPMAQEMLERYLTIRQLYPEWFQKLDIDDPELEAIIDSGYLVPLPKRDRHGRKVLMSCAGNDCENIYTSLRSKKKDEIILQICLSDYPLLRTFRSLQILVDIHGANSQHGRGNPVGRREESDLRLHVRQRRIGTYHEPLQRMVLHGHSQHTEMHTEQHADASQGDALHQHSRHRGKDSRIRHFVAQ